MIRKGILWSWSGYTIQKSSGGFDPNIRRNPEELHGACIILISLGFPGLVTFVVTKFSSEVSAPGSFDDVTILHLASRDGHVEVARLLLGADVTAQGEWIIGCTAFAFGIATGVSEMCSDGSRARRCRGADATSRNNWTIAFGIQRGHVQMHLECGADATSGDKWRSTPSHPSQVGHGSQPVASGARCGCN